MLARSLARTFNIFNNITSKVSAVISFVLWVWVVDNVQKIKPLQLGLKFPGDQLYFSALQHFAQLIFTDTNQGVVEALQV